MWVLWDWVWWEYSGIWWYDVVMGCLFDVGVCCCVRKNVVVDVVVVILFFGSVLLLGMFIICF